jgi:predicted HTH transcriptional regulator
MNLLHSHKVKQMILEGEGVSLDFKKTITSCEKIAKTIVSFANNKGGMLFIGVADNGSVVGVKSEDEEKYMIEKACSLFIKPLLDPFFEEIYIDHKLVLIVHIKESDIKPHYALDNDKKWWAYIRVEDKSLLASKIVLDVLKKQHQNEGVLIEYSTKETELLKYLSNNDRITLGEYAKLINTSKRKASRVLVNLLLSGILKVNSSEKGEFFTSK